MKLTPEQIADKSDAYVAYMSGNPIIGKVNQQGAVWIPIVSEHIKDYLWEERWLLRPADSAQRGEPVSGSQNTKRNMPSPLINHRRISMALLIILIFSLTFNLWFFTR